MSSSADYLTITPSELKFRFELRKQVPTSLRLYNPNSEHVAFKVKTTSPKKYCVRPNTGMVAPGATTEVIIIMQQQKEVPPDLNQCKDKFLVQSVTVASKNGVEPNPSSTDFQELFSKDRKAEVKMSETKLKVSYIQPIPPPSPVPENQEAEAAATAEENFDSKSEASTGSAPTGDLQAKYNSLLSSLAVATKERNTAQQDEKKAQKTVADLQSKMDAMAGQLASAQSAAATTKTATKKVSAGFTLIHLLLTAILAFLIGRYT
mmetsp:Transcript_28270/g.34327  ORF Transcript_28270/g.34327 Transcript_28270/m.34327 type:complete len:263 (-) Transcript_28270:714-1502(-)|eukprot:CAMPEP_0197848170 /NCGR_PEP_ID=MMETSP1438-20131217/7962_1 /TAXON_ID=1461541 /ORGANISM="Pterosperma sp., Strain CCMP1384" /LENGTH=262 /DNA_ID=CAMNT_0043460309 /DNA_START=241 /DNA_END=1029 /DNA_ORIENTATION=-